MDKILVSTAQFEHKNADKDYNLSVIAQLSEKASDEGTVAIAFHECSITGYTFARHLTKEQMLDLAEFIPDGKSTATLVDIAKQNNIIILCGLFEKDQNDKLYNTYVCVDRNGLIVKARKLHPFINPYLTPGEDYCIFEINGWKCGILICYDNNIIENVRAMTLLGVNIIFMPHVTMCTPSPRPGAGLVSPDLWKNRETDPDTLRLEFDGMKGRQWLMKWLPSRAYDNGIYAIFSNPVGMDDDQVRNGCSMIIDPFGDILTECRTFENNFATAAITPEKLVKAGGYRYIKARRPDLYRNIIGQSHNPEQKVAWIN
jgi:predicted amidohydrolase